MDVEAYLRRIRYSGPREPSFETLRQLHRQHLFTVPFENWDIALGWTIRLDSDALFDKIVLRQRGGFCYELNGLFYELLSALGFKVERLSARVHRADGSVSPEFDHMLLKVMLDQPYIADVGFGESFVDPLLLKQTATHQEYALVSADGAWDLIHKRSDGTVATQYRFAETPRQMSDFAGMCLYHQTSPESHFTQNRVCSLALPDGRVTVSGRRFIETRAGDRQERELRDQHELESALRERFGIDFKQQIDWSRLTR